MSLGVITHNAKGIIVQRFELQTIENFKGTFFIPQGLCCTNPLEDGPPLTPDGFSLRPRYGVCQEL